MTAFSSTQSCTIFSPRLLYWWWESVHCVKSFPTQRFSVGSGLCGDQSMCENNLSCSMKSLFWLLYAWAQVALRHPRTARLSAESICCWQRQCRNYVILYYVGYSCLCCCWSISKLKWNQVFKKQKYSSLLLFMLCCLSLMILFSHFSHLVPYLAPLVNQSAFDEHIDYPRLITCSWDFGRKAKEGFCRWKPINVHRPNRP